LKQLHTLRSNYTLLSLVDLAIYAKCRLIYMRSANYMQLVRLRRDSGERNVYEQIVHLLHYRTSWGRGWGDTLLYAN